jgi:hypothetical protein
MTTVKSFFSSTSVSSSFGGRDRIERGRRLVEQQHLGLHRDPARDAQALLLPAGKAEARRCCSLSFTSSHRAARRSAVSTISSISAFDLR